jgi:predicted Fe-S protein YdhL (DUF1289 family)
LIAHDEPGVASPCSGVCRIDGWSGLCQGCWRTREEIADWLEATDDDKLTILAAVDRRRAEHDPCGAEFRGDCDR